MVSRHNINIVEQTHAQPMKYDDYILQNTWNYRFPLINYSSHHMVICTNGIRDPGSDLSDHEASLMSYKFTIIASLSLCLLGSL